MVRSLPEGRARHGNRPLTWRLARVREVFLPRRACSEKRRPAGRDPAMSEQTQLDVPSAETVPAYRSVARSISARILNGELPVGSTLPSETTLAQAFGINRSTVREAIRVLEESGMLRRRPGGKRLFVSAPRHSELASRMKAAMVLHEMSFLELWE